MFQRSTIGRARTSVATSRLMLVALLLARAGAALGQPPPRFTDLGVILPGGIGAEASDVSGDNQVVVGRCNTTSGERAFIWTRPSGMQSLGTLGGNYSRAFGVNSDGTVIVGESRTLANLVCAFRWVNGVRTNLTPTTGGNAKGVSANGSVVVGMLGTGHPFRWTSATGVVDLGFLPGATTGSGGANGVSADGSTVFGSSPTSVPMHQAGFRWTAAGGMVQLPSYAGTETGPMACNGNGTVFALWGTNNASSTGWRALRWTVAGAMEDLGTVPGDTISIPYGMSDDGTVVVGMSSAAGVSRAFVWTPSRGMRSIYEFLTAAGVDLTGWTLTNAVNVSPDGTTIVGVGTRNGESRSWAVDYTGDADGDGMQDMWEIAGIPYNDASGISRRYVLPGADPLHKDLYVEVDSMSGFDLSDEAISMVAASFAAAPLQNPDGNSGVRLHVLKDHNDLPHVSPWQTNGCWPLDFGDWKALYFGTDSEFVDPAILAAKKMAFRYCIIADDAGPAPIGGCGLVSGDDLVVFMEAPDRTVVDQAAIFMHELGHCLGLHHGGSDTHNGKPNYPSIMNYVLSYRRPWNSDFWRLDYSRAGPSTFPTLEEWALDETAGIGPALGFYRDFVMPFGVNVPQGGGTTRAVRYVWLNGSPTDFGDNAGTGFQDGQFATGVIQDLNYAVNPPPGISLPSHPSTPEALAPCDDWAPVRLATKAAAGPGAPVPSVPTDELTTAAVAWMEQNFPPPPPAPTTCYPNCDGSSLPPILNVLDFACFLNRYAAGESFANCDASTTAPTLNVQDFACFLNAYASGCT